MTHCHHPEHSCLAHHETSCVTLVPIFNHLEPDQMDEITALIRPIQLEKGETLYRAGDPSQALYIVNEGKIRITRLAENGKEQLLRVLDPGHFAGELSLFSESIHEDFAVATEETRICMITREDFQGLMLKYPSIAMKVLAEFSKRLEQSERLAARVTTETVETRLAKYLLDAQVTGTQVIELSMAKKDVASYLGMSPETLSRKLADLENQGFITMLSNKRIKLLNPDALANL